MTAQTRSPLAVEHHRGTGMPLVYLADHGSRSAIWRDVASRLAPRSDWFWVDLVGSGRSPTPERRLPESADPDPYDPIFQAAALARVVDAEQIPPFILVGHGFATAVEEPFATVHGDYLADSYREREMERGTGFEPAASCLEGKSSTPELPPLDRPYKHSLVAPCTF